MAATEGFHEGELAVQRLAGVEDQAARLSGMMAAPHLSGGASFFLAERDLAVLGARDREGGLWVSPLVGAPGFLDAHATTLQVGAVPVPGDPLADLQLGKTAGLIAIDFETRRRMRVNGTVTGSGPAGFEMAVDQAYGNCPQYIQQRHLDHSERPVDTASSPAGAQDSLGTGQRDLIERADTFFLGTEHPTRGTDASHRGGTPGFVRVEGDELWWPDYPGNNMFNSLGNLAVDDSAALLFVDFATGETVQLSGTATVDWIPAGAPGDDGGTGRRVRFAPRHVWAGHVALHADSVARYRRNPALTS